MAELKTKPNDQSVDEFLESIPDETLRRDCQTLREMMESATGSPAQIWGSNIVGFGRYEYRYASGHGGSWFQTGFAPRKQNLTLYIMPGFEQYDDLLSRLGKHKIGKSCLYVKRLADVDNEVLRQLIDRSVEHMAATNQ